MSSKYQSAGKFHFFRTSAEWKFYGAVSFQVSTFLPQIILHDKFSTLLCSTLCNILRWKKLASEKFFRIEWRVRFVSFELHTAYTWPLCRTLLPTFYERRAVDWVQKCERMRWSCADFLKAIFKLQSFFWKRKNWKSFAVCVDFDAIYLLANSALSLKN